MDRRANVKSERIINRIESDGVLNLYDFNEAPVSQNVIRDDNLNGWHRPSSCYHFPLPPPLLVHKNASHRGKHPWGSNTNRNSWRKSRALCVPFCAFRRRVPLENR